MTKGHNQKDAGIERNTQGQNTHLKEGNKDKSPNKGRNKEEDVAKGKKGKNNI